MGVMGVREMVEQALRGMTQEQLAKRIGTTQQTISRWSRGDVPDTGEVVAKLVRILNEQTAESSDGAHASGPETKGAA